MKKAYLVIEVDDQFEEDSKSCNGCPFHNGTRCALDWMDIEWECPKVIVDKELVDDKLHYPPDIEE